MGSLFEFWDTVLILLAGAELHFPLNAIAKSTVYQAYFTVVSMYAIVYHAGLANLMSARV